MVASRSCSAEPQRFSGRWGWTGDGRTRALLSLSIRTVPTELVLSVSTPHEISFLTKKSAVKMFENMGLVVKDQSTWTTLFWPSICLL